MSPSDLLPEASETNQIEDLNEAEAGEYNKPSPVLQNEETRGRIASRDINLDFSESNIISGPRTRQSSRQVLLSPSPQRKEKRKDKHINFVQFKLHSYAALHKSILTATIGIKRLHWNDLLPPPQNWREMLQHS